MKSYELLYLIDPSLTEEERAALSERVSNTFAGVNATIESIDAWDKRKLAYEINGLSEGEYFLVNFQAEPDTIAEISRILRITDQVVRFTIARRIVEE